MGANIYKGHCLFVSCLFGYVMLNACRSIQTSALVLHCCSGFVLQLDLYCSYKRVGFISVPILTHRYITSPKFSSLSFRWLYEQFIFTVHSPWKSAPKISNDIMYIAELILKPDDGSISVPVGKPSVLFLRSLKFSSSPIRCNFLFVGEQQERGRLGEGWISKTESRAFAWSYGTVICVFNVPVTSVVQLRYIYFNVCTFYRHWRFRYYWNKMNLPFISYRL